MQKYLNQLIEDMRLAATRVPQSKVPEGTFDEDYMMELEEMEEEPMSYWLGCEMIQFPPADRLKPKQLSFIAVEFENLLDAFSFEPDFPEGLPAKRRYELMRNHLDHKCTYWPGGWVHHFEFCNYEPENCPFGNEFCKCKDIEYDNQIDVDFSNLSSDELPF